jgi:hypothetical protein
MMCGTYLQENVHLHIFLPLFCNDKRNSLLMYVHQSPSITAYSQTCFKRSPLGQRKSGLLRQVTYFHMKFFMMGKRKR